MSKGISFGCQFACVIAIAHVASMALAETIATNNNTTFNDTTTTALAASTFSDDWNVSFLFEEVEEEEENEAVITSVIDNSADQQQQQLVLKGQSNDNDSAMQLRHNLIGQKKRQRHTKRQKKTKMNMLKKRHGRRPGGNNRPNRQPNPRPNQRPNQRPGQQRPSGGQSRPTLSSNPSCFSTSTYDSIDEDIFKIASSIRNDDKTKSHFLGGIVRLAAHDFMDYDRRNEDNPMGPDGCYDVNHPSNDGLETIWCRNCALRLLYEKKYSGLSRADFWVASANAVIRQTSVRNALNLKETFKWGRKDRAACRGSGDRLPESNSCNEVEDVFLTKMGLRWKDAVALMGGHTLGRGDRSFSGHHGTWVDTDKDAQVFDKAYYEELFTNPWRPRNMGRRNQDWTTGRGGGNPRVMLNTDVCLVFDIEELVKQEKPCCTRTNSYYPDGTNRCVDREAARKKCPMYSQHDERQVATDHVREMLGGSSPNNNNRPFYTAFAEAWGKATTVGQDNLLPLRGRCERT